VNRKITAGERSGCTVAIKTWAFSLSRERERARAWTESAVCAEHAVAVKQQAVLLTGTNRRKEILLLGRYSEYDKKAIPQRHFTQRTKRRREREGERD
jgi:hypothetical protein